MLSEQKQKKPCSSSPDERMKGVSIWYLQDAHSPGSAHFSWQQATPGPPPHKQGC